MHRLLCRSQLHNARLVQLLVPNEPTRVTVYTYREVHLSVALALARHCALLDG